MNHTRNSGETWRSLDGAKAFFGCGRATIETLALEADAKRKVGRRALYNVERMSEYLSRKDK